MKRLFLILFLAAFAGLPAQAQDDAPVSVWQGRNEMLVQMAGLLGSLHHYHSVCRPGANWQPNLYRDRMMEMIRLEDPYDQQEQRMIDAFNNAYLDAREAYPVCSRTVENEMQRLAIQGEDVAYRLGAPFQQVRGYDYDAGDFTIENGVRVYRGTD